MNRVNQANQIVRGGDLLLITELQKKWYCNMKSHTGLLNFTIHSHTGLLNFTIHSHTGLLNFTIHSHTGLLNFTISLSVTEDPVRFRPVVTKKYRFL